MKISRGFWFKKTNKFEKLNLKPKHFQFLIYNYVPGFYKFHKNMENVSISVAKSFSNINFLLEIKKK